MTSLTSGPVIFPLPPLPTPHQPQFHSHHRRSRRVVLRYNQSSQTTYWGNQAIISLNHLYSYRYRLTPYSRYLSPTVVRNTASSPQLPTANSAITQRLLSYVHNSASRFCCELRRHMRDHGDLVTASNLVYAPEQDHTHIYQQTTSAIPIIASRVSLPTEAGTADLLSILPKDLAKLYSNESKLLRSKDELALMP